MSRRMPGRRMVIAVRTVKAAATTTLAGTAIVLTLGGALASPGGEAQSSTDTSARLAERSDVNPRCAGASGQAVVLTSEGRTRTVPFEQGWKIYRGERPGTLIAVCPD
jgi:hypothetical protein